MNAKNTLSNVVLSLIAGATIYTIGTPKASAQEVSEPETDIEFFTQAEQAFNDASYNLGMGFLWKDDNNDNKIQLEELVNVPKDMNTDADKQFLIDSVAMTQKAIDYHEIDTRKHEDDTKRMQQDLENARLAYELDPTKENKEIFEEITREILRDQDMGTRRWVPMKVDFSSLPEAQQRAAWQMIYRVAPLVEKVHFQQMDPNNLKYMRELIHLGNVDDYVHFWNSGGPWCLSVTDPLCSSHPSFPKRVPNAGHLPESVTEDDLNHLKAKFKGTSYLESLLSCFVDRKFAVDSTGKVTDVLDWTSANVNPAYKNVLKEVSKIMLEVSNSRDIDPSIADFLRVRAYEFNDDKNPYPFFGGDLKWRDLTSALEILLGPYEWYKSAFGLNATMEMNVGARSEKYNAMIDKFKALVPGAEKSLAKMLGEDYIMRDFSNTQSVILVTHSISVGDGRVGYFSVACKLPNKAIYGRSDLTKIILFANNLEARERLVLKPMSYVLMERSQADITGLEGMMYAVLGHEIAHSLGPNGDYRRTDGRTPDEELGDTNSTLEEAKADLLGIVLLKYAYDKGEITKAQLENAVLSMLPTYARGFSFGLEDAHGIGAMIEFVELYKRGVIAETPDHKYTVNLNSPHIYDAFMDAALMIINLQLHGSAQDAKDLINNAYSQLPENVKQEIIPALRSTPKDLRPWYTPVFGERVNREMYEMMRTR